MKYLRDFVDLMQTDGVSWDNQKRQLRTPEDVWDKFREVCGTFYSILVEHVLGANSRVSLEPRQGRIPQEKTFVFFR